jgi:hypothetical protein
MARVRRPAAEWAELIDEWHASGLSLPAFCERNGLNFGTMSGWVYKRTHKDALEEARREAGMGDDTLSADPFVPVRVLEAEPEWEGAGRSGIEVVIGAGRRIAVGAGFDAETLLRVVAVLEGRPC